MLFHELRHYLQLFKEKLTQTAKDGSLLEKVEHFGRIDDFPCFFEKLSTFCNFLLKRLPKRRNMVAFSKKLQVSVKSTISHAFSRNQAFFAFFCRKVDPNAETWWFARKGFILWPNRRFCMVFRKMRHLSQLFAEKLTETSTNASLFQKLEHFGQIDDFSCFFTK